MTSRWRTRLIPLVCLATALVVVAAAAPRVPAAFAHSSGDDRLAQLVEEHRPPQTSRLATAVVTPDGQSFAGFGADEVTEFEIGSISKVFTGLLLADAVDRGEVTLETPLGEVTLETPLGEILELRDAPVATVTLRELATHTSGLPRLPADLGFTLRAVFTNYTAGNPYTDTRETLLEQARNASVATGGEFEYSNFGAALLGQALAARSGLPYADLLRERITDPLGMASTYVPSSPDELRPQAVQGYAATGKAAEAWTMGGMAPAGGIRSTAADLAILAEALLNRTAPGSASLDTVESADGTPMGMAWFVGTPAAPAQDAYRWHNGQTGGFSSMLVLDLEGGRASLVLSNVSDSVDDLGVALLEGSN